MKKILIFAHTMELGGAEKALLGLLEVLDTTKYEVDLFLMRHEGELLASIPDKIKLLPEIPQYASLAVPFSTVIKRKQFPVLYGRYLGKKRTKKRVEELGLPADNDVGLQYSHLFTLPFMPEVNEKQYDAAISFLTPHYFVAEKVNANIKFAWIHTDYSMVAIDVEEQHRMWSKYDYIVSISKSVTQSFTKMFPTLEQRIIEVGNMMPMSYIKHRMNAFSAEDEMPADGCIRILSIGRFCTAKNFDNVPEICRRIRSSGYNVKWYLIGYGTDEQLIKEKIIENEMQRYVIILGKKNNPYPYLKTCDLYVQPSRYEGKCISVIEAQIMHKPVVITQYATSSSQLEDGIDGVIVPKDNEGCAAGIVGLLKNQKKRELLIIHSINKDYSNAAEIRKIDQLIK